MKKPLPKHYIEDDILMVHKPIGISSFGLVSKMRRVLDTRKIGHAGTLDPLASGLMILGINKGTKKINTYMKRDKVYIADIIIGRSTTTGDREGDIVAEKIPDKSDVSKDLVEEALKSLLGEHYYPAPLYSAVKVLGKPLYKYAREGIEPPFIPEKCMDLKKVEVFDIYKSAETYIVTIRAEVGSGTYIRTLAEEFGKKLGYPASLKKLYRISIAEYSDKNAYRLDTGTSKKSFYDILKNIFAKKSNAMNILFQSKQIDLTRTEEHFMARRLENLGKFFSPSVYGYVDIEYRKGGQFNTDVYYISIRIEDGHHRYFTDEYQEDLRSSFDHAFGDIFRMIRNDRSRSRRLLKKAGRRFKKIFKKRYK